jgi:gag-polyprotein putative aspartyl protease
MTPAMAQMVINGVPTTATIDTGAVISLISRTLFKKIPPPHRTPLAPTRHKKVAQDSEISISRTARLKIATNNFNCTANFLVADGLISEAIIGNDIIFQTGLIINVR